MSLDKFGTFVGPFRTLAMPAGREPARALICEPTRLRRGRLTPAGYPLGGSRALVPAADRHAITTAAAEEDPTLIAVAARQAIAHALFRVAAHAGPIQLTGDERAYFAELLDSDALSPMLSDAEVERRLAGSPPASPHVYQREDLIDRS